MENVSLSEMESLVQKLAQVKKTLEEMSKFDEAIYILIVDLISKKERFGSKSVNLEEITESVKDNIRTSLNKLYLQQLIDVDSQKNITLKQKK